MAGQPTVLDDAETVPQVTFAQAGSLHDKSAMLSLPHPVLSVQHV